jgi:hypothetical protein
MEKIPLTGSKRYKQLDAHIGQGTYGKVEKALDLFDNEYESKTYKSFFEGNRIK